MVRDARQIRPTVPFPAVIYRRRIGDQVEVMATRVAPRLFEIQVTTIGEDEAMVAAGEWDPEPCGESRVVLSLTDLEGIARAARGGAVVGGVAGGVAPGDG